MTTEDALAIRGRRLALGITQRRLAMLAGCSLSALRDLEGGFVPRQSQVVVALLAVLDQREAERRGERTAGEASP